MDRDDDRQNNLDGIISDTRSAIEESGEIMRDGSEDVVYDDQHGRGSRAELAEKRAYREKVDRQSPIENYAMQNRDKYTDVRDALKQVSQKRNNEFMLEDLEAKARAHGTDIPTVLRRYVNLETQLRTDVRQGMLSLAHSFGIDPGQISQALAPYAQAHPAVTQAHTHDAARYHEAVSVEQEYARAMGAEYKQLEPLIVQVLRDQNFTPYRTGDFRQDLNTAIQVARNAARRHREGQQSAKSRRASRGVGGGGGNDGDYEPRTPRQRDRLSSIRDDIEKASREIG